MKIDRLIGDSKLSRMQEKELIRALKKHGIRFYFVKEKLDNKSLIHFKAKFPPPGGSFSHTLPIDKDNFSEKVKDIKDYVFRFLITESFADIYAHNKKWFKMIDPDLKTVKDLRMSNVATQELWSLLRKEKINSYTLWTIKSAISCVRMAYKDGTNIAFSLAYCLYILLIMPLLPISQIYVKLKKHKSLLRVSD